MQQVANFGRNANNGTNAGSFYWNLNNDSSNDRSHALSSLMAYKGWVKTANAKMLWRKNVSRKLTSTFPVQLKGAI